MLKTKSKIFKIILILNLVLLLTGTGIAAHHLFFNRIEIKIDKIEWIDEFKMTIAEIELKNEPCFLIIDSENSKVISEGEIQIQKQNIKIGKCTNSKILVPLRIESKIKKDGNLFFVPQFRARIKGPETEKLKADFSLYLLTNNCIENRETIQGKNFVLCDINIASSNVRSFSITERRKNILSDKIMVMADKHDYTLVLKVSPCLETVKNLSSFSIIIENITPEVIVN